MESAALSYAGCMRRGSDFTPEPACREAEAVLLDRRYFELSADAFERFTDMLDEPPEDNPKLRRLLPTRAPWETPINMD